MSTETPAKPYVFTHANGQSTERNAAEAVMMRLGLDHTDFRERDPLVAIIGKHLDEERAALRTMPVPCEQPESLSELVDKLLQHPQGVRELVRRLVSLSTAAHDAASCLVRHGENGLSSVDNVERLWGDLQLVLKKFDPPKTGKVWKAHRLDRDANKHAMHNRRKHGPVCIGCTNQIGFYKNGEFMGTVPMLGRVFQTMRPGDTVETEVVTGRIWKTATTKTLTVDHIEGLMVHLKETKHDVARTTDQRDPGATGTTPGT